jgi:hypothetical protein
MTVDTRHPEYTAHEADWRLLRDFIAGERRVKDAGTLYLPRPQSMSDAEYTSYTLRSVLYEATGKTAEGMVGAIFRREPSIKLPAALEYLREDADGGATPLAQVAKVLAAEVCAMGRAGLLVDYPQVPAVATRRDEIAARARAQLLVYEAEAVINWRYERIGAAYQLSMLVLKDDDYEPDGFGLTVVERRRVFRLDQGLLTVEVFERRRQNEEWLSTGVTTPRLPGGQPLGEIPFQFVGAEDLLATVDRSPVLPVARLNAAHYRNSADYEDALFMLGQPTPWISGLSPEFVDKYQGQLRIGSRSAWLLPPSATAGMLESQTNLGALKDAMEAKERQMAAVGARLFQAKDGNPEAEGTVRVRAASEANTLQSIASNVSRAVSEALVWAGAWMSATGEATIALSDDFFPGALDPASLDSLIRAWQSGAITKQTLFENLLAGEIIAEGTVFDQYADELENEAPTLPGPLDEDGDPADEEDDEDQAA